MAAVTDKLIFIHIYKNAGTSIRAAMGLGAWEVGGAHNDVRQVIAEMGEDNYRQRLSFAVARNPYDHLLSLWYYVKSSTNHPAYNEAQKGFEALVSWVVTRMKGWQDPEYNHLQRQIDFVTWKGKISVDRILRYENLQIEWAQLCRDVAIPVTRLGRHNKSHLRSEDAAKEIRKYPGMVHLIDRYFSRDFQVFGYSKLGDVDKFSVPQVTQPLLIS